MPHQNEHEELFQLYLPYWEEEEKTRKDEWTVLLLDNLHLFTSGQGAFAQGLSSLAGQGIQAIVDDAVHNYNREMGARLRNLLVQLGVPMQIRGVCWRALLDISARRPARSYYSTLVQRALGDLCNRQQILEVKELQEQVARAAVDMAATAAGSPEEEEAAKQWASLGRVWLQQIEKDLPRTFPGHPMMGEAGRAALRRVLAAYALRNPSVGYCQGMNFLAGALMMFMSEEDCFFGLAVMVEEILAGYFSPDMTATQVDQLVFKQLVTMEAPEVAAHLEECGADIACVFAQWFLCAFVNFLPLESCLRVWDVLFYVKSCAVLFQVALALVDIYSPALLATTDVLDAFQVVQSMAPLTHDATRLVTLATEKYGHVNQVSLGELREEASKQLEQERRALERAAEGAAAAAGDAAGAAGLQQPAAGSDKAEGKMSMVKKFFARHLDKASKAGGSDKSGGAAAGSDNEGSDRESGVREAGVRDRDSAQLSSAAAASASVPLLGGDSAPGSASGGALLSGSEACVEEEGEGSDMPGTEDLGSYEPPVAHLFPEPQELITISHSDAANVPDIDDIMQVMSEQPQLQPEAAAAAAALPGREGEGEGSGSLSEGPSTPTAGRAGQQQQQQQQQQLPDTVNARLQRINMELWHETPRWDSVAAFSAAQRGQELQPSAATAAAAAIMAAADDGAAAAVVADGAAAAADGTPEAQRNSTAAEAMPGSQAAAAVPAALADALGLSDVVVVLPSSTAIAPAADGASAAAAQPAAPPPAPAAAAGAAAEPQQQPADGAITPAAAAAAASTAPEAAAAGEGSSQKRPGSIQQPARVLSKAMQQAMQIASVPYKLQQQRQQQQQQQQGAAGGQQQQAELQLPQPPLPPLQVQQPQAGAVPGGIAGAYERLSGLLSVTEDSPCPSEIREDWISVDFVQNQQQQQQQQHPQGLPPLPHHHHHTSSSGSTATTATTSTSATAATIATSTTTAVTLGSSGALAAAGAEAPAAQLRATGVTATTALTAAASTASLGSCEQAAGGAASGTPAASNAQAQPPAAAAADGEEAAEGLAASEAAAAASASSFAAADLRMEDVYDEMCSKEGLGLLVEKQQLLVYQTEGFRDAAGRLGSVTAAEAAIDRLHTVQTLLASLVSSGAFDAVGSAPQSQDLRGSLLSEASDRLEAAAAAATAGEPALQRLSFRSGASFHVGGGASRRSSSGGGCLTSGPVHQLQHALEQLRRELTAAQERSRLEASVLMAYQDVCRELSGKAQHFARQAAEQQCVIGAMTDKLNRQVVALASKDDELADRDDRIQDLQRRLARERSASGSVSAAPGGGAASAAEQAAAGAAAGAAPAAAASIVRGGLSAFFESARGPGRFRSGGSNPSSPSRVRTTPTNPFGSNGSSLTAEAGAGISGVDIDGLGAGMVVTGMPQLPPPLPSQPQGRERDSCNIGSWDHVGIKDSAIPAAKGDKEDGRWSKLFRKFKRRDGNSSDSD